MQDLKKKIFDFTPVFAVPYSYLFEGLERNFTPFKDNHLPFFTHKKIKQGTGLGVAVCYSIFEQHTSEISIQINSNKGLTTGVSRPIKRKNITNGK